jgi:membrane-associated phospholipid phosphatase
MRRLALFVGTLLLWVVCYFGIAAWHGGRGLVMLSRDPVLGWPVWSAFVLPYLSFYAMPIVGALAIRDNRTFRAAITACVFTILAAAAVFAACPVGIARPEFSGDGLSDRLLLWLWSVDKPTNLLPSLHVALAFLFAGITGKERPNMKALMFAWAIVVSVSTLFTRQHYLIDVVTGMLLAYFALRLFVGLNALDTKLKPGA